MKYLLNFFSIILLSSISFLQAAEPGTPPHTQSYYCNAVDRGWEEHRPHRDCHACLRHHDQCVERCYETRWECEAIGENNGFRESFRAYSDRSEFDACDRAMERCSWRARNCRRGASEEDSRLVSSDRC